METFHNQLFEHMVVARYLTAFGFVAAAVAVRAMLAPYFGFHAPYLLFFPAILLASWYGGFGPGVFATALSAFTARQWYLRPEGMGAASTEEAMSLALFATIGVAIASLNGRLRQAHADARTEAARALARAERLDAVINTTVDAIIIIDATGAIESFNPGAERLFDYAAADVIGKNVNVLMPEPFHGEHDGYIGRYLDTGRAAIIGTGREVRGQRRDGSTFPLHLSVGEMTVDGQRKFTGMLHDLSDRVELEQQLRSSEERWRAIIASAVDAIIVIDARGRIESFNPAASRLFGYSEDEVRGHNVNMLMPSPYHEEHDGYLARYMTTRDPKIIGIGREVTGRRHDGSTFPLHLSVGETMAGGERKFTGILHDLTARVALEARLREQSALAKLGEMAAMIAHEVKNPLAGIRGAVQVIGGRMPVDSSDAAIMTEIVRRVDSLDTMMKDLLLFARPPKPNRAPTDIVPLIAATAGLLKEDENARDVHVEIRGQSPAVSADGEMLKMVFHNLLINGAHAMHGRGRIRVEVSAENGGCEIAVSDEGSGIPPDVRDKVFIPFFTTKRRGTGLGLPTAKRFIEAHHGTITIQSPPSGGTTVVVHLPMQ